MRMMKSRSLRRLALGLAIALPIVGLIIWIWVIPAVIVAAIRQRHEGYVTIAGWWINGSSAGVTGLTLHEEPAPGSPTWADVDRVATDLSLGALLTWPVHAASDRLRPRDDRLSHCRRR